MYWFRVPDDEQMLMSLSPAQLRCYLVVIRRIQRLREPVGVRDCTLTGVQHLESSESACSEFASGGKAHQADCGHSSQKARTGARAGCDISLSENAKGKAEHPKPTASRGSSSHEAPTPRAWTPHELAMVRSRLTAFWEQEPLEEFELGCPLWFTGQPRSLNSRVIRGQQ